MAGLIVLFVARAVLIAATACACDHSARQTGVWPTLMAWAGVAAVACGPGAALLCTGAIGRVTWRNRAASYLIPWGGG